MKRIKDSEIINSLRNRDYNILEYLYNRYSSVCLSFSYSYIKNKSLCEEIVQDSFVALWNQSQDLPFETRIEPLLFTIVRNKSISAVRRLIKQRNVSIDELTESDYYLSRQLISLENFDTSTIDISGLQSLIDDIYESLPQIYKEVFSLKRYEDKSNKEIAELLGISIKTVEKRMTKTLKIFKDILKDSYFVVMVVH